MNDLKFTEAIKLGSTMIRLDNTVWLDHGCGCLVGMAAAALGMHGYAGGERIHEVLQNRWPWITHEVLACCSGLANAVSENVMTLDDAVEIISRRYESVYEPATETKQPDLELQPVA